jgi:hypothetical protein
MANPGLDMQRNGNEPKRKSRPGNGNEQKVPARQRQRAEVHGSEVQRRSKALSSNGKAET